MSEATQYHTIEGEFPMQHGVLRQPSIAFETWGTLNFQKDNAILLFTGLSPSAHAASSEQDRTPGWWEPMIGEDKPVDTSKYFVICINSLGSCFGSTGPASIDPATGENYRLAFPVLTIEDIARAGHAVIESMGITKLHTVMGASMGGMTAVAHSVLFPEAAESLVSISSSARPVTYSIALRSLQREMIRSDADWNSGDYDGAGPTMGMRLARKLGMLTYRGSAELAQRFGLERVAEARQTNDPFGIDFEVESYLESHAKKFVGAFDANCYLYLSRAMDLFDIADHGGTLENGLARVGAKRALVIGVESDTLFPIAQQRELAEGLDDGERDVEFKALPSVQGHDAFLVDMDRFRPLLCDFFNCSMNQPGQLKSAS
ncbi:MAG: homoserine O-acetyltransferase [OM182 bacterium MED-G24]|uniref:Serine O-succinyltransferase n=1 Tax=OM182 bacterium MED-G24 TaxID=1986255 RepID=A0A2A5WID9_9GAMM|nr:MAG: homoserine O-acetyltransferase [OM182 bacterium MED-G24]